MNSEGYDKTYQTDASNTEFYDTKSVDTLYTCIVEHVDFMLHVVTRYSYIFIHVTRYSYMLNHVTRYIYMFKHVTRYS